MRSNARGAQAAGASSGASALAAEVAHAPRKALFTILDARLAPGTADQGAAAAAVSANFLSTAHTLVLAPAIEASPLGKLLALRFRVELELPAGFHAEPGAKISEPSLWHSLTTARVCSASFLLFAPVNLDL